MRVRLGSSLFASGLLINRENIVYDGERAAAKITMNASHI
jgi:hypothetical protein